MANVVLVEELPHGLPERARLPRRALVADGLAHEHEPPARPGARGREEVSVAARRIGPLEARAAASLEAAARVLVEERLDAGAPRQRPLLEPEDEDRVEAARARAQQVDDGDPARRAGALAPDGRALERGEHVATAERPTLPRPASGSSSSSARPTASCACEVGPRPRAERRGDDAVGVAKHRRAHRATVSTGGPSRESASSSSGSGRPAAELGRDLDRAVSAHDAAAAQLSLDPVHLPPLEPRVRRAQVGVELRSLAVRARRTAGGRDSACPNGVARSARRPSNAIGTPSAAKAVSSGTRTASTDGQTTAISSGRDRRSGSRRAPPRRRARASRAFRPLRGSGSTPSSGARCDGRREQLALDVRERRRQVLGRARRQLDDPVARRAPQVGGRACERGVDGAARLVRQGDVDVGACRERLEEAPLGAGEVLEAVREHRAAAPRPELARQPLDRPGVGACPRIPCVEPLELVAVRARRTMRAARRGRRRRGARRRARRASGRARRRYPGKRDARRVRRRPRRPAARRPRAPPRRAAVRAGPSPRASASKSASNVPIVPASSPPSRRTSSRSTRSTSARFGTISQGSRSIASTKRSSSGATFPACAGPTTRERPTGAW